MAGTRDSQWELQRGDRVDENWVPLDTVRTCYPNATSADVFKAFDILNEFDKKFRTDYLTSELGKRRATLADKQDALTQEMILIGEEEKAAKKRKHQQLETTK